MTTRIIIAICGRKRSGKDAVGSLLANEYGYGVLKFASPMKDAMKSLFSFDDDQLEGSTKEVVDPLWGITPRRAMQYFGTEIMQYKLQELVPGIERRFFAENLVDRIRKSPLRKIVITDMRFPHEESVLREFCEREGVTLTTLRVERQSPSHEVMDGHASEHEHVGIHADIVIENVGTLDDLHDRVRKYMAS